MQIPKRIDIIGQRVETVYPYVFRERSDCHALACVNVNRILVAANDNDEPLPEEKIAEHLFHEIAHHVSQAVTGEVCLGGDEVKHGLICRVFMQVIRDNKLEFNDRSYPMACKGKGGKKKGKGK